MPARRDGTAATDAAVRHAKGRARDRQSGYVPFKGIPHPTKPGYYLIRHPSEAMTPEERAFEMWAVHPADLDAFDMSREMFFHAHLVAAMAAAASAAADAAGPVAVGEGAGDI